MSSQQKHTKGFGKGHYLDYSVVGKYSQKTLRFGRVYSPANIEDAITKAERKEGHSKGRIEILIDYPWDR